jgi:hypothetical protein
MATHKTERAWAAALRKAVMRQVSETDTRRRIERIADKTVELAMEGDLAAIIEVGNRLDGKAKQQLEIQTDNRLTIVIGGDLSHDPGEIVDRRDIDNRTGAITIDGDVSDSDMHDDMPTLPAPSRYEGDKVKGQRIQRVGDDGISSNGGGEMGGGTGSSTLRARIRAAIQSAPIVRSDEDSDGEG